MGEKMPTNNDILLMSLEMDKSKYSELISDSEWKISESKRLLSDYRRKLLDIEKRIKILKKC